MQAPLCSGCQASLNCPLSGAGLDPLMAQLIEKRVAAAAGTAQTRDATVAAAAESVGAR